jgi:hypothetical protein
VSVDAPDAGEDPADVAAAERERLVRIADSDLPYAPYARRALAIARESDGEGAQEGDNESQS